MRDGGSDGTSGGVTDDWKTSVDRQLAQLHGDVRSLLNRGAAAVVALALMIGGLYIRTDMKFERVEERLGHIEVQQQKLDDKIDIVAARLDAKLDLLIERTAPKGRGASRLAM